jgi:hypothetical protein
MILEMLRDRVSLKSISVRWHLLPIEDSIRHGW